MRDAVGKRSGGEDMAAEQIEFVPVKMVLPDLLQAPVFSLPSEYEARTFRPGDERVWAEIETAAGEFASEGEARDRFEREFGDRREEVDKRCFFIGTGGRVIGTAMGWYGTGVEGGIAGRVHWVGIHPGFQGRGLGRPLVSLAVECLKRYHESAYLTTQTTSARGVKVYLDFGFRPVVGGDEEKKGWRILAETLGDPRLDAYW